MTARCIVLGDGTRIGLGRYVAGWRRAKALPGDTWIGKCPDGSGGTAADALRQCRAGLHDRINRHLPGYGVGRKWTDDWHWQAKRFSREINTPRLVIRWVPPEFRARFGKGRHSDDV
jgi:hypothetical protein